MNKDRVAPAEMEVLRYVIENCPASARQVAEAMASTKGFARTTTQTLLERLRKKGHLSRRLEGGINTYEPTKDGDLLLKGLVGEFIQNTLGGSISPVVAFLSEKTTLTEVEAEELRALLRKLEDKS